MVIDWDSCEAQYFQEMMKSCKKVHCIFDLAGGSDSSSVSSGVCLDHTRISLRISFNNLNGKYAIG